MALALAPHVLTKPVTRPSPETLAWVARTVGRTARVLRCRRLVGGISSSVHQVSVEDGGRRHQVVLRQLTGTHSHDPRKKIEREAALLVSLDGSGIPAPRLLGTSPDGRQSDGIPSLLMTRVPGHVHLTPRDAADWIWQMACALPPLHSLPLAAPHVSPWLPLLDRGVPQWSRRPELWRQAIALLQEEPPNVDDSFIHADYQHFNLLWRRERLTGIVDWTWSGRGAADRDVGHCRLNLAVLFSVEWAERFRHAYEAEAGRRVDRWWDVHEIALYSDGWQQFIPVQVGGRRNVDIDGMHDRVEALLALALAT